LKGHKSGPKSGPPIVAMYDGKSSPGHGYIAQMVGVVIFAVVGNWHLPKRLFKKVGMTGSEIAGAFTDPQKEANLLGAKRFVPVGRCTVARTRSGKTHCTGHGPPSGTRQTFAQQVLLPSGSQDTVEQNAGLCPASNNSVCLEPTTMDLLAYVNS